MCYACGQKIKEEQVSQPEAVAEEEASEDEIACPSCKTMVSADALMCYACGANIKDALAKLEQKIESADDAEKSGLLRKPQIFVKKIVKKKVV